MRDARRDDAAMGGPLVPTVVCTERREWGRALRQVLELLWTAPVELCESRQVDVVVDLLSAPGGEIGEGERSYRVCVLDCAGWDLSQIVSFCWRLRSRSHGRWGGRLIALLPAGLAEVDFHAAALFGRQSVLRNAHRLLASPWNIGELVSLCHGGCRAEGQMLFRVWQRDPQWQRAAELVRMCDRVLSSGAGDTGESSAGLEGIWGELQSGDWAQIAEHGTMHEIERVRAERHAATANQLELIRKIRDIMTKLTR